VQVGLGESEPRKALELERLGWRAHAGVRLLRRDDAGDVVGKGADAKRDEPGQPEVIGDVLANARNSSWTSRSGRGWRLVSASANARQSAAVAEMMPSRPNGEWSSSVLCGPAVEVAVEGNGSSTMDVPGTPATDTWMKGASLGVERKVTADARPRQRGRRARWSSVMVWPLAMKGSMVT
jgi:hypothetical protein